MFVYRMVPLPFSFKQPDHIMELIIVVVFVQVVVVKKLRVDVMVKCLEDIRDVATVMMDIQEKGIGRAVEIF